MSDKSQKANEVDARVQAAELALKETEEKFGPDSLEAADALCAVAKVLRESKIRSLDAANLSARAKVIRAKNPAASSPGLGTCPFCAEQIQPGAKICRFCNRTIPVKGQPTNTATATGILLLTGGGSICGLAIVVALYFLLFFDISVESGAGGRVINLSLISFRNEMLMVSVAVVLLSGIAAIAGLVLTSIAKTRS